MVMGSGGSGKTSFQREKNFSRSPRAPLTLSRKAGKLFYLYLPVSGTEPIEKCPGSCEIRKRQDW